jgi:hypothetical protein
METLSYISFQTDDRNLALYIVDKFFMLYRGNVEMNSNVLIILEIHSSCLLKSDLATM